MNILIWKHWLQLHSYPFWIILILLNLYHIFILDIPRNLNISVSLYHLYILCRCQKLCSRFLKILCLLLFISKTIYNCFKLYGLNARIYAMCTLQMYRTYCSQLKLCHYDRRNLWLTKILGVQIMRFKLINIYIFSFFNII